MKEQILKHDDAHCRRDIVSLISKLLTPDPVRYCRDATVPVATLQNGRSQDRKRLLGFVKSLVFVLTLWGLTTYGVFSFSAENNAPRRQTRAQRDSNLDANSSTQNRNRDSGNNSKRRGLFPTDDEDDIDSKIDFGADDDEDYDVKVDLDTNGGDLFGDDVQENNAPFDESVTFVDPDFKGCDIVKLYNRLRTFLNIQKGDYEETLKFERRKDKLLHELKEKPILGKISLSSRIATPVYTYGYSYNADTATLTLQVNRVGMANSILTFNTRSEVGGNFFDSVVSSYGVLAEKNVNSTLQLNVPTKVARDLKDNIRALLVFTIDPRKVGQSSFVAASNNVVFGRDVAVWFYDGRSGEILIKKPLASGMRPTFQRYFEDKVEEHTDENGAPAHNEYDSLGFTGADEEIDPHYHGIDPEILVTNLRKFWTPLNKDEFETSEEYKYRRQAFIKEAPERKLYADFKLNSRIAIGYGSSRVKLTQHYDADMRLLAFHLEGRSLAYGGRKGSCAVLLKSARERDGYNYGSYGSHLAILASDDVITSVANDHEFKSNSGLLFFYRCSADEALSLKGHVKALVVFSIDPSVYSEFKLFGKYKMEDSRFSSPHLYGTFSHPATFATYWTEVISRAIRYDYDHVEGYAEIIPAKDVEVWFYDDRTGKVFKKSFLSRKFVPKVPKEVFAKPGEEEEPPPKTWQELLAESVDEPASWEKKKPAIIVPDDCATLAEAIEKAKSGDVVQLKKANNPYPLGVKLGAARKGVVIDKPLAIVGETGEASEVTIEVGVDESIFVETKGAMFKGITFQCGALGLAKTYEPIVSVGKSGYATFKYCSFVGNGVERSIGVETSGKGVKSAFWKCDFKHFGDSGLLAKDEAVATLRYCEFLDDNHYAFTSEGGASVTLARCHFVDNEICIHAETGGSCEITESRFAGNKRRADISPASRNRVKESENVYDE